MTLRVVPMGGLGEIGLNCMLFDDGDSALLVDAGRIAAKGQQRDQGARGTGQPGSLEVTGLLRPTRTPPPSTCGSGGTSSLDTPAHGCDSIALPVAVPATRGAPMLKRIWKVAKIVLVCVVVLAVLAGTLVIWFIRWLRAR